MKKFAAIFMAAVLAFSMTACGGSNGGNGGEGSTDKVYKIKLHHDLLDTSAQHQGLLEFEKIVEEKSGGRLQIDIFPNNTLGSDTEVAEMLQTGSVEAALIPTAKLSGFHAPLQVIDLPYLFPDRESLYTTLDDQEFKDMLFGPMEGIGFHGINFWESGFKQLTANKTLTKPEDFKGVKFRTMESPLIIAQFEALGAVPTPIDLGETYNSLQQGVVDGEENPLVTITAQKFYEVQSDCIISNHAYLAYAFLFGENFWNTLPEDLQQIIIEAADEAVAMERQMTIDNEMGYIETIEASGTKVTTLTSEQTAVLADVMKPVHEQFRDVVGSDLLDKAYALVDSVQGTTTIGSNQVASTEAPAEEAPAEEAPAAEGETAEETPAAEGEAAEEVPAETPAA